MITDLIPEWLGLIATPLAVIGSTMLLGTGKPIANATCFATGFAIAYTGLSLVAIAIGDTVADSDDGTARYVVSLVIGLLFLAAAVAILIRPARARTGPPAWARALQRATPRSSLVTGLALSLVNPNVAILLSGLTIVVTAGVDTAGQLAAASSLVLASLVPLVVPVAVYVTMGPERGHALLTRATTWMIDHQKMVSAGTLLVFGGIFALRGYLGLS